MMEVVLATSLVSRVTLSDGRSTGYFLPTSLVSRVTLSDGSSTGAFCLPV